MMETANESLKLSSLSTRALYASLPFDTGQATLFVKEKGFSRTTNEDDSYYAKEPQRKRARISGEEARQFYEDVLLMPEESRTSESPTRRKAVKVKHKKKRERKAQKTQDPVEVTTLGKLFLCAQQGDLEPIRSALSRRLCDVNVVDNFNWTLLMCAAHAGHMTIVRHLLDRGAEWRHNSDKRGNNAADLARIAGHSNLAEFIEAHTANTDDLGTHSHGLSHTQRETHRRSKRHTSSSRDLSTARQSHESSSFYCDICKINVELGTTSVGNHTTSTVHQFSCQHKPKVTPYGIPESNRGFQLLLKGGWDPERGLGPEQQGQKFPVKTVLKQDRLGFGLSTRAKPRVTHFSAHDKAAVKSHRERSGQFRKEKAQPKKKDIVKAAEKDRRWEIRMRRYMNADYDLPV